jgi:hypothetical protein
MEILCVLGCGRVEATESPLAASTGHAHSPCLETWGAPEVASANKTCEKRWRCSDSNHGHPSRGGGSGQVAAVSLDVGL